MASKPTYYYDGGIRHLELHAKRAPLGPYTGEFAEENDPHSEQYNFAIECAVRGFSEEHGVEVFMLGRSGRHVCIADTPENRKRYASLKRAAEKSADALWAFMRGRREPKE